MFLHRAPNLSFETPEIFFLYGLCSISMTIYAIVILNIFSKDYIQNRKIEMIFFLMFINIIFTTMAWIRAVLPDYNTTFYIDYVSCLALLLILNIVTLFWLIKTAKEESEKRAVEDITAVYSQQVEHYLMSDKEELEIRKLRHDLMNFLETQDHNKIH